MFKNLLVRSFKEASAQLWRNKFLSMTTILLGALILFLLNFVFSIEYYVDHSLKKLESRADFTVPLRADFDSFTFDALKTELANDYDLDLTIREKQQLAEFSVPVRLHIKFNNLSDVSGVLTVLKKIRYDSVIGVWDSVGEQDFVTLVNKLLLVRSALEKLSLSLMWLFFIGGVLLMINTFRIVIFSRKSEIFIARLVGADMSFIMTPFLIEGFLLALWASIISIILFVLVLSKITFLPGGTIFLYLYNNVLGFEILIAGLVGILGAFIAIRRYLVSKVDF